MKYGKKYLAVLLACLVCAALLWGCGKDAEGETEQDPQQQEQEIPVETSDSIECCDGSRTLRFEKKENGTWVWKDDETFPLDQAYIEEMFTTAREILALTPVESSGELSDYGLEDTQRYLTLTGEEGQAVTYYLGDLTEGGCYYMRRADDESNRVYVAPAALTAQVSRSIYDMAVLPKLPELTAENISAVTVALKDSETPVEIVPDGNGAWLWGQQDVTEKVNALLEALTGTGIVSCVDYRPSSGAAAICGLDPASVTMTVAYVNGAGVDSTFVLRLGTARGQQVHGTIQDDSTIYGVDGTLAAAVQALAA